MKEGRGREQVGPFVLPSNLRRMRSSLLLLLACVGPPLLLLWCLLAPPLFSYHPFHPNHSHLPSSYLDTSHAMSSFSPSFLVSSALLPPSFIEGWYLKLRSAGGRHFALIYMYFVSADPDNSTAAITLLDAHNDRSHIFRYPIGQFKSSPLPSVSSSLPFLLPSSDRQPASPSPYHDFELHIANNTMSPYAVSASLRPTGQSEAWVSADVNLTLARTVTAAVSLSERYAAYPWSTVFSPASHTVGLFAFLPLSCYQQVIELQLAVSGHITIDGQHIDMDGATAYYEKTRGSTFPDSYLWIHASHFTDLPEDGGGLAGLEQSASSSLTSFFFSLASVPILPTSLHLPGFVCSFVLDGRVSHFATQLGSVLTSLTVDERTVEFVLYDQYFTTRVAVTVTRSPAPVSKDTWLWAARNGHLRRVIPQRLGGDTVHVTVQQVRAAIEQQSQLNSGDSASDGRSEAGLDALSFTSRGYSLSRVLSSSSSSVGLEVFVHESELQQQVAVMYNEVRPWMRDRYAALDTPFASFSISNSFARSLLPEAISGMTGRLSVTQLLLLGMVSVLTGAGTVSFLLISLLIHARRGSRKVKVE